MARVLLIDDDARVRDSLAAMLESLDHEVVPEATGAGGLERLAAESYDLLVTDLIMPRVDGAQVIEGLKRLERRPKVIVISGGGTLGGDNNLLKRMEQAADQVLKKPFGRQELAEAVNFCLRNSP